MRQELGRARSAPQRIQQAQQLRQVQGQAPEVPRDVGMPCVSCPSRDVRRDPHAARSPHAVHR